MAKYLLIVESNSADPKREAEFNDWYNKTHLPDVLQTPGFVRATRYESIEPVAGKGKFLCAYEIETDDLEKFTKAHSENMAKKRAAGRISELLVLASRGMYKQTATMSR